MLHNKWQAARSVIADEMRLAFGAWPEGREKRGEARKRKENIALCPIHFRNHRRESWWMPA